VAGWIMFNCYHPHIDTKAIVSPLILRFLTYLVKHHGMFMADSGLDCLKGNAYAA
jgi:hypothetical protein